MVWYRCRPIVSIVPNTALLCTMQSPPEHLRALPPPSHVRNGIILGYCFSDNVKICLRVLLLTLMSACISTGKFADCGSVLEAACRVGHFRLSKSTGDGIRAELFNRTPALARKAIPSVEIPSLDGNPEHILPVLHIFF